MSWPPTAVGPRRVETNPILMEPPAVAGAVSARAVAPASQNAVLIFNPPPRYFECPASRVDWHQVTLPIRAAPALVLGPFVPGDVFCARNRSLAASTNRRLPLRTFGSCLKRPAP